ncbi:glycosyltransferase family 4 protein [Aurantimonas sp. VKM B-3413]|uniref:glycosyltransferase family 4 protein n=1 Tax=Aurantimonas sp. VKM B-3413 TaxID=2779401 RepID=UPI001E57F367|nr:glycosyltransferase family 4 protein [Aurantimonas sp. VKM B-3413]MCB8839596.1 glycosyltransferase family 4 protein [Aurantimonas sp. VKM B-3413]
MDPHFLFVSSLLPDKDPTTGYEIANQAIVAAYRRQGVRLTLAGFRRPGAAIPEGAISLGDLAIENAGASRWQKMRWVAEAMMSNRPIAAAKVASYGRRRLLERLAEAGPIDGLILNSIQMPAAYPFLARAHPSIFIAHNVEHKSASGNAESAAGRLSRLLYRREASLLKQAEARICRDAVVVHTLSAEDATGLGLAGAEKCLPLALSVGRSALPDTGERRHDVGLIGTWSWAPNRIGLDWFVSEVAPRLPAGITVAIAGRFDGPPPSAPENVRFVGRVPDAQAFVNASRVVALATKGGTGVQLKTLETFEEGMPAVATPQALRGIDSLPANVRIAEAADDFASALVELVEAERTGRLARLDGGAFARSQTEALDRAVAAGLHRFARESDRRSAAAMSSPEPARRAEVTRPARQIGGL